MICTLNSKLCALLLVGLALLGACATITPDLPPITDSPTNRTQVGKVVWHDLLTNTPEASKRFYGELFGWTFEAPGIDLGFGDAGSYELIRHNGRLIGGIVDSNALGRRENVSQWITMLSVDDIDAAVASAAADGGDVLTPPTRLASRGSLAVVQDPTGAIFAMLQAKGGDPLDHEPTANEFLWNEVWTNDVERAASFYQRVLGYEDEVHDIGDTGRDYRVLRRDGAPRAGLISNPFEDELPVWVAYLRVEDPAAITARVPGLGGRVIADAQPRDIGGQVALIAGPSGAGIALQTWPLNEEEDSAQ